MRKLASFIFGTCLLGAASSCSESQFNITGKVTCEGKPVKAGLNRSAFFFEYLQIFLQFDIIKFAFAAINQ